MSHSSAFRRGAHRHSAFTLIELLVVIAIIAALAAILFPVFAKAREKARQAACMSNLKQIGLGILQYNQDFDETFPLSVVTPVATPPPGALVGWADAIQPYIKNRQVFSCPGEPFPQTDIPYNAGYTDYWMNKNAGDGQQTVPLCANPSLTILLGDGGSTGSAILANSTARYRSNGCNGAGDGTAAGMDRFQPVCPGSGLARNLGGGGWRHSEGANYGFADGHVKWIKNKGAQNSAVIWNGGSTFAQSGSNPTFRLRD